MRSFAAIWSEIEQAKAEACRQAEEAKLLKQRRTYNIYVDTEGNVCRRGDFHEAQNTPREKNSEIIWWASSEPNWKSEWEISKVSCMDRYQLEKWLKKARDKLHHISVPLKRRTSINQQFVTTRITHIAQIIQSPELPDSSEIRQAIKEIDEIMQQLRNVQKELKMQIDPELTRFRR